jgi:hypothetical protein
MAGLLDDASGIFSIPQDPEQTGGFGKQIPPTTNGISGYQEGITGPHHWCLSGQFNLN